MNEMDGHIHDRRGVISAHFGAPTPAILRDQEECEIIDLDARRPHYVGDCECLACRHRWMGVVITIADIEHLECPACGETEGRLLL